MPTQTLAQGRGACIGLALLRVVLWEHIGLHSSLIIMPRHAFMARWMQAQQSADPVVSLNSSSVVDEKLRKAIADGQLLPANSVEITAGMCFDQAIDNARAYLARHTGADDLQVIDICAARESEHRILPLPEAGQKDSQS